jgi:hypothetical protein
MPPRSGDTFSEESQTDMERPLSRASFAGGWFVNSVDRVGVEDGGRSRALRRRVTLISADYATEAAQGTHDSASSGDPGVWHREGETIPPGQGAVVTRYYCGGVPVARATAEEVLGVFKALVWAPKGPEAPPATAAASQSARARCERTRPRQPTPPARGRGRRSPSSG